MTDHVAWVALSVFIFFFALVTVMGFFAARWKSGPVNEHLDEWGLGGRQFGTWITWFLVGGDFYTAYTVIAVPALVYAVGEYDLLKGFEVAGKNFNRPVETYLVAAVVYFVICYGLSTLVRRLQKKIAIIR